MKSLIRWRFAQKLGGLYDGPNDATGDNFKKNIYEAFVREAIQNSIDARRKDNDDPVVITFTKGNILKREMPTLFDIRKNIEACLNKWKKKPGIRKYRDMLAEFNRCGNNIPFLLYSDTNTTGMDYSSDDEESGFYAFVKSGGNSVKDTNVSGGSYGYGKAALLNMSNISTLLVSTQTPDGGTFFSGLARLSSHTTEDGIKRESQGYYTDNDEEEPITDIQDIPLVFRRKEAGTSFFILCPYESQDNEMNECLENQIIKYVIKHFWLAIFKNELEVNIRLADSMFDNTVCLKRSTLNEYASRFFGKLNNNGKISTENPVPYIKAVTDANKDKNHLVFEKELPHLGKVYLYLRVVSDGPDIIQNFRGQHMLIRYNRRSTNYGYYGVFVCDGNVGNSLLQAAENAQHREWDVRNAYKYKELYEDVKAALDEYEKFIGSCISEVFFTAVEEGLDVCDLEDYLSIPIDCDDDSLEKLCRGDVSAQSVGIDFGTSFQNYKESDFPRDCDDDSVRVVEKPLFSSFDDNGYDEQSEHTPMSQKEEEGKSTSEKKNDSCEEEQKTKSIRHPFPNSGNPVPKSPDEDGEYTSNTYKVMIDYRVFTKRRNDELIHVIVINSLVKSSNVSLKIYTLSFDDDNTNTSIPIIYTDNGIINKNNLCKVKLVKGRNIVNIKFGDNLRHSIKVSAKRE